MFSFFKKKSPPVPAANPAVSAAPPQEAAQAPAAAPASRSALIGSALVTPIEVPLPGAIAPERQKWLTKLKAGLGKTASSISAVFGGNQIDEALYENLESALLMSMPV